MTHASLFSGIGGLEVAATMLGWDNVFHCEINEFGRKILDYWYPKSKSYEDITKTDFSEWRGKVDVLTGGFPCQPFSYAGKRRGADDDRYLWPYMFKAIDQIRPAWVVAENVAGITTMVEQGEVSEMGGQASLFEEVDGLHRYRLSETFTLQRICDDLEGHGYSVQPVLIPACAVGAPHRRDRVFIVARRITADTRDNERIGEHRTSSDTASDGRGGCTCKDWSKRCNCGDTERIEKEDTDGLGLRREPRTAGVGTTASNTTCCGTGTPGESAGVEGRRSGNDVEPGEQTEWSYGFYELLRHFADTESEKSGRCQLGQPGSGKPKQGEFGRRGGEDVAKRNSSYPHGSLLQRWDCKRPSDSKPGYRAKSFYSQKIQERWDSFPTVPPVHRGNDGIPFDVDGLAIPFSKWRTESLKAYGNAIVPQVIYEIFRAIELVEQNK